MTGKQVIEWAVKRCLETKHITTDNNILMFIREEWEFDPEFERGHTKHKEYEDSLGHKEPNPECLEWEIEAKHCRVCGSHRTSYSE